MQIISWILDMQIAFCSWFLLETVASFHVTMWILVTWKNCVPLEAQVPSPTPFTTTIVAVADVAKEINDPESMWPHSPKSTAARNGLAKF